MKFLNRLVVVSIALASLPLMAFEAPLTKIIRSDYQKGEITQLCDVAIADLQTKLSTQTKTAFDIDRHLADLSDKVNPLTFMGYVSTNSDLRDEGSACEEKSGKLMVETFTRRDLYKIASETRGRTTKQNKLISEVKRSFEQNGMALSDADLQKFKELKSQLSSLEAQFSKNLNADVSTIVATESELEGVPQDFITSLQKDKDGKFIISVKENQYAVMGANAKNPNTRERFLKAYESRAGAINTPLIEQAVALRSQIALLTGYKNWADYRIDGRMAKDSATALGLLSDLQQRLHPRVETDLAILLKAKQQMEDPNATKLEPWDINYFSNQVKKRDYSVDQEEIRKYFPKDLVMNGMFEIYQKILGVKFEEIQGADVWSPDVKMYVIRNPKTKAIIAYFYTDFFSRDGKYGHAAAFPLIAGRKLGLKYSRPVASIVANLPAPANGKPSLLSHGDVDTVFHEFGHIMHQTLTRAPYAFLSGSSTAQDFVEAPSQMLENWVWNKEVLKMISGLYTDATQKLPDALIEKMILARDFNLGYYYTRQIIFGVTDLTMHTTNGPVDPNQVYRDVYTKFIGFGPVQGSQFMASFGHLMGGYDAGYYGYIWSEVYAADMFTKFKANGLLDEKTGKEYRKAILEKGAMQPPLELVEEFLGRPSTNDAFLKKLGL